MANIGFEPPATNLSSEIVTAIGTRRRWVIAACARDYMPAITCPLAHVP